MSIIIIITPTKLKFYNNDSSGWLQTRCKVVRKPKGYIQCNSTRENTLQHVASIRLNTPLTATLTQDSHKEQNFSPHCFFRNGQIRSFQSFFFAIIYQLHNNNESSEKENIKIQ